MAKLCYGDTYWAYVGLYSKINIHSRQSTMENDKSLEKGTTWKVKVTQLCPTLWPMDYEVHGILQARILSGSLPFSRGSSQPSDQTQVSHIAGRFFTSWATRETHHLKESANENRRISSPRNTENRSATNNVTYRL